MKISYGPPGRKGVTHLMAVGADDLPPNDLELATRGVAVAGFGLSLIGLFSKNRVARDIGAGAAIAGGVLFLIGRRTRTVVAA